MFFIFNKEKTFTVSWVLTLKICVASKFIQFWIWFSSIQSIGQGRKTSLSFGEQIRKFEPCPVSLCFSPPVSTPQPSLSLFYQHPQSSHLQGGSSAFAELNFLVIFFCFFLFFFFAFFPGRETVSPSFRELNSECSRIIVLNIPICNWAYPLLIIKHVKMAWS